MRPVARLLAALLFLGCGSIQGPQDTFYAAELVYASSLETAVGYAKACAVAMDEPCARFIVKLRDVNREAQEKIFVGRLVADQLTPVVCDEAIDPGCNEARAAQLQVLAAVLRGLAFELQKRE